LKREQYDAVFTLLPTAGTHGHHRAATLLALEAVDHLSGARPIVFGVDAGEKGEPPLTFTGLSSEPLTRTVSAEPALVIDRDVCFGYRDALSYRIVVDWLIAEHKSQGLFQSDYNKHRFERFWLFAASGGDALQRLAGFEAQFQTSSRKGTSK
jgi:hypothetical protein